MDNKVKIPCGGFYLGDGLTVDPVTRTVSAGGSGGGFEYDFIINAVLGETGENLMYTLEKGTYAQIMEKLGTQPINGRLFINAGDNLKGDYNVVAVEYANNKLSVYVFTVLDAVLLEYVINPDNTVTEVK